MRLIDPTPEIAVIVAAVAIGWIILATEPTPPADLTPMMMSLNYLPNNNYNWCDRYGWTPIDQQTCEMLRWWPGSIPLPHDGSACPSSYELWFYDKKRPPICVERA